MCGCFPPATATVWKSTVRIFPKCCCQESRPPLRRLRRSPGPGPPPGQRVTLQSRRRFQGRQAPRGTEGTVTGPTPKGVREAGRPRERAGADAQRTRRAASPGGRRGRKVVGRVGRVGRVGAGGRGPRALGAELPRRSRERSGGSGGGGGGRGVFSGAQCRMVLEAAAAAAVVAAASLAAAGGGAVAASAAAPAGGVKWRISRS